MKKNYIFSILMVFISLNALSQTSPSHENYLPMGSKTTKWYEAYERWSPGTPLYSTDEEASENENFFISR
ncbi:MAG: hypothetical protein RR341_04165, partial [Bacteroidales bacterium]